MARLSVTVRNVSGTLQVAKVRGHVIFVDLPEGTGTDLGPTPSELFLTALADCVAMVISEYCLARDISPQGLTVTATADRVKDEDGVDHWANIKIHAQLPPGISEDRARAIQRHIQRHCPVTAAVSRAKVDYEVVCGA